MKTPGGAPHDRRWVTAFVLLTVASLWLRTGFPVTAVGWAQHDDLLFLRQAISILRGEWLGSFDNLTLAKGPFYPIFIAIAYTAGLPLKLAEQLVYLGISAGAAWWILRVTDHRPSALVAYAVLALNPALWTPHLSRVLREALYLSLAFGVLVLLGLAATSGRATSRGRLVAGASWFLSGTFLAAYWLTREERPWMIAPGLVLLLGALALRRSVPGGARHLVAATVLFGIGFAWPLASVAWANQRHYGTWIVNEFRQGSYRAAYGALVRIRGAEPRRYVVFPAENRRLAYSVSPAARELRPSLDGVLGEGWRRVGCSEVPIEPCDEVLSGWFMWELRDAVQAAGHYGSASDAQAFYARLAREVNGACADGRLDCLPPRETQAPPFRWSYVGDVARRGLELVGVLFRLHDGNLEVLASSGDTETLKRFRTIVGEIEPAPEVEGIVASGWVALEGARPHLGVSSSGEAPVRVELKQWPAPEISDILHRPDLVPTRFWLSTDCVSDDCELSLGPDAPPGSAIPLASLSAGGLPRDRPGYGHVDSLERNAGDELDAVRSRRRDPIRAVARLVSLPYELLLRWLAAGGLLILVASCVVRPADRDGWWLVLMASACALAVALRIALLAYLAETSLPTVAAPHYMAPASPLLLLFVICSWTLGWRHLWPALRRRATHAPDRPARVA